MLLFLRPFLANSTFLLLKKVQGKFARNGLVYRSSDEEIQRSVWHFSVSFVEVDKQRAEHATAIAILTKPAMPPLRIAAREKSKKAADFSVHLPCFGFVGIESSRTEGKRQFLRARFYRSTKIRLFAHFAPAGILLGSAFPKPCHAACAAKNLPPPFGKMRRLPVIRREREKFSFSPRQSWHFLIFSC